MQLTCKELANLFGVEYAEVYKALQRYPRRRREKGFKVDLDEARLEIARYYRAKYDKAMEKAAYCAAMIRLAETAEYEGGGDTK